jgi:CheY-like chemotaxis protein
MVLLMEDEDTVRVLTRLILPRNGYTVLEARYGGEALELVERQRDPVDLMVTDMVMPEMNGRELARGLQPAGRTSRCCTCRATPTGPSASTVC